MNTSNTGTPDPTKEASKQGKSWKGELTWREIRDNSWELFHLGLVVRDMEKSLEKYDALGLLTAYGEFPGGYTGARFEVTDVQREKARSAEPSPLAEQAARLDGVRILQIKLGPLPVEIIQMPKGGQDANSQFLDNLGEGIAHIGFFVDDLEAETAKMLENGIDILLQEHREEEVTMRYFDLREFGGFVLELKQKGTI